MNRPCTCNKPESCRLCWLWQHDPRYKTIWTEPVIDASKADVPAVWNRKDWITPVELPKLEGVEPTKPFAVVTCAVGEKGNQLLELSEPSLRKYAQRIGADFHVIGGDTPLVPPYPMFDKFRIGQFYDYYERIVFIDADIVIRDTAPNLLEVVPENHVGLHDDLPKNSGGYAWYFTEVEYVQRWQKMKLKPVPYCLNTGLVVASRQHRGIFDPATEPFQAIHCFEQHLINCRIADADIPVHLFDSEVHWQWWFDKKFSTYPKAKFIHFAGLQDHEQRLRMMEMASVEVKPQVVSQATSKPTTAKPAKKKSCGCGKKIAPR